VPCQLCEDTAKSRWNITLLLCHHLTTCRCSRCWHEGCWLGCLTWALMEHNSTATCSSACARWTIVNRTPQGLWRHGERAAVGQLRTPVSARRRGCAVAGPLPYCVSYPQGRPQRAGARQWRGRAAGQVRCSCSGTSVWALGVVSHASRRLSLEQPPHPHKRHMSPRSTLFAFDFASDGSRPLLQAVSLFSSA
jgi:hypothetical protein